jgi:hypothetical protein
MVKWKSTIDLQDLWAKYEEDHDVETLKASVTERLTRRTESPRVPEGIVKTFPLVEDIDEFDAAMGYLYDWADAERVWIKTFV